MKTLMCQNAVSYRIVPSRPSPAVSSTPPPTSIQPSTARSW